LNVRNIETFQEALIAQYRDLIHEAILESETEHKTRMDIGRLNSKLKVIYKAAAYDGLNDAIINQLIEEAIPTVAARAA
jgi:prophage maintenance system killer protein